MNKKLFACMVFGLALTMALGGLAEYVSYPLSQRVTFCESTGLIYYAKDGFVTLEDYAGNVINSGEYVYMKEDYDLPLLTVIREDGLNTRGVLNAEGKELVPCKYAIVNMIDADWQVGLELTTTDSQDYDYKDRDKEDTYYIISKADYYHKGELAGSVDRTVYDEYCRPYGDYLYIKGDETGAGYALSKKYGLLSYTKNDYILVHKEYGENGFHFGSGQQAFTAGCTLTPEEVSCAVNYDINGDFLDLQGNVLSNGGSPYKEFTSVEKVGDYLVTRTDNKKYGIADLKGNEIAPAVYDKISYCDSTKTLFAAGYQLVSRDGKFCYLDRNGQEVYVSEMEIPFDEIKGNLYNPLFVCVQSLGKTVVFTPTAGQLAESYDEVDYPRDGSPYLGVKKGDLRGVIDMNGEYVIPLGNYWFQASDDGFSYFRSGNNDNDHYYELYHFAKDSGTEQVPEAGVSEGSETEAEPSVPESAEQVFSSEKAETQPSETGEETWKCTECGTENTGKFCTNCGTEKPQQTIKFCPNCGWKIPEGTQPKFCSECGAKL